MLQRSTAVIMLTVALVAGCGSNKADKAPSVAPTTTQPTSAATTNSSPDGKEVLQTHCNTDQFGATKQPKAVNVQGAKGNLVGVLKLYKSGVCEHLYWSHFTPGPGNAEAFIVTIQIGDDTKKYPPQKSEPDRPDVKAYTVGAQGNIGDKVKACVAPAAVATTVECLETTVV
jgi:hypothetical protein